MTFYESNLAVLVLLNIALFYHQRRTSSAKASKLDHEEGLTKELLTPDADKGPRTFVQQYLIGHLLAFAGDWLQVRGI